MQKSVLTLVALAASLTASASFSQTPDASGGPTWQSQPAPIERHYQSGGPNDGARRVMNQPIQGLYIVSDQQLTPVTGASTDQGARTELQLAHGRANITLDHPEHDPLILIDLPGGQVDLVKDGFYTLNADTNTLRVLHGEADVFPPSAGSKGITVHENEQIVLAGDSHPTPIGKDQERADLIQPPAAGGNGAPMRGGAYAGGGYGGGYAAPAYGADGYAPYGDGYAYPYYPYYGWGYPYYAYWGYPYWGWGYPYWGFGWGWGGWYGRGWGWRGGYAGGFRGGYVGGGFHGGGGGFHSGGGGRR
jgi:hypothetical protein